MAKKDNRGGKNKGTPLIPGAPPTIYGIEHPEEPKRSKRRHYHTDLARYQRVQEIEGSLFTLRQLKRIQSEWNRRGLIA